MSLEIIEAMVFITALITLSPVSGSFITDLTQGNISHMTSSLKKAVALSGISTKKKPFRVLNIMNFSSSTNTIPNAVIFIAIIILPLLPLALNEVEYPSEWTEIILKKNIWIYGVGGLFLPFIGIKLIDIILQLIIY